LRKAPEKSGETEVRGGRGQDFSQPLNHGGKGLRGPRLADRLDDIAAINA
jgi:hypothetical protein